MNIRTEGSTVFLSGEFDVRSTGEVRSSLDALLAGGSEIIVVDLHGVTCIDLTALKVLAAATRRASLTEQHLRLRGCCPAVRRLLHLSRLIRVVEVERQSISA
jgi:anti-anti-sigma factor